MENVPELRHHDIFQKFLDTLREEKFDFAEDEEKQIVYCPDYGMAQQRSRLVVVASRLGPIELIPLTQSRRNTECVRDVLKGLPPLKAGEVCQNQSIAPMQWAFGFEPQTHQTFQARRNVA